MNADILIVGGGIFGLSTAYHLAQRTSDPSTIVVLDRASPPSERAASTDINKIVRADYSDPLYMELGLEAIEAWKNNPLFKDEEIYHQTGWIMCDELGSDLGERIRKNFQTFDINPMQELKADDVRNNWDGLLKEAELSPFGSFYFNPLAGWADAGRALELMAREIQRMGVRYVVDEAERLVLGDSRVEGVESKSGEIITATKVVLCTGAWTSALMAPTEDILDIPSEDRLETQMTAAGVCVAHLQLSEEEKIRYNKLPVYVYGGQGEVIPPTSSGILKFTSSTSFQNTIQTSTGHIISIPTKNQSIAPKTLQNESINSIKARLPQILSKPRPVEYYRLCWDAITPDQHPLITQHPHPHLSNLFLAAGGSFHCWKFLPTIGTYVANVLSGITNGTNRDSAWSWKWKRTNKTETEGNKNLNQGGVHSSLRPRRQLRNIH